MSSNLGWPPAQYWENISYAVMSSCASTGSSDQLNFVWDSSKGKSTWSNYRLTYKRYYNLVCVLRRYKLGWPPAPLWASISCLALSISSATGASDEVYFVWDSSKGKSTGSDHRLTYKRYYNLVCVLRRSNLGWPPVPLWASISCLALSISSATGASDQLNFVWDSSKVKSKLSSLYLM